MAEDEEEPDQNVEIKGYEIVSKARKFEGGHRLC